LKHALLYAVSTWVQAVAALRLLKKAALSLINIAVKRAWSHWQWQWCTQLRASAQMSGALVRLMLRDLSCGFLRWASEAAQRRVAMQAAQRCGMRLLHRGV